MLRPSATLTFTLFGPDATQENASAVKRSYSYIAPTLVKAKKPAEDETFDPENIPVENTVNMTIRLPKNPYWLDSDEGSRTTWSEIVLPWVTMKLNTLFETVQEYNNPTRKSHVKALQWKALELAMEDQLIEVELEPDNSLRDIAPVLENVRAYLNSEGIDRGAIERIFAPSDNTRNESDWLEVHYADNSTAKIEL